MSTTDWVVVLGGVVAIGWVNWYFFFAERSAATVAPSGAAEGSARGVGRSEEIVLPEDGSK